MNKSRRKRLEEAQTLMDQAKSIIEECQGEEQDAYDNLPESLQDGEKGSAMSDAIDIMGDVVDSLEEDIGNLDNAINC